jgi:histidinol-phosphate aminotransferase
MEADFVSLANHYISGLTPYQPGKPIEELERELGIVSAIKLASNENPLGASPKAIAAAQQALLNAHLYPDGGCFELKATLSTFLNVPTQQITIGNGSENVLEMIVKAYLSPGNQAMVSEYAFLTILLLIKSYGGEIVKIPAQNFGHDINGMIAAATPETRIIFIVNPNNPTGTYTTHDDLVRLLDSVSPTTLVVLDEAYHEYINQPDFPDSLQLLKQYPNLVISRTFSKAYGLAALRVGYAISSPKIADILNRARLPFNVNTPAALAARAAILDQEHVSRSLELNNQGMLQMIAGLQKLNLDFIPSLGNFITLNVKQNGADIYQKLLRLGVIVRPLGAYDMPTYLRVTIGTAEQNARFLQALHDVITG